MTTPSSALSGLSWAEGLIQSKGRESTHSFKASYLKTFFSQKLHHRRVQPALSRRAGNRRRKKGLGLAAFLLGLPALAIAALAIAWFLVLPAGPDADTFVDIAPGSSTLQIAAQLEQAHVIRSRYAFDLVRIWKRGRLKPGEYRFDQPASVSQVYARIARGDIFTLTLVVPEGANRFDIANRVQQAGLGNSADFLAATVAETPLLADLDPHAPSVEGYLFPATYHFPRKATPSQIIAAMVQRFRAAAVQIGLKSSFHSVVTLASLVERETAVPAERPLVASVLINRLGSKMPLMTDPAVIYGLLTESRYRGAIYASDLALDTPYNTYKHPGLPPGPIANPGLPALRAALNPANTTYLYFVAAGLDPQGQSRFASTLDEHSKNVAAYRLAVKQAGAQ